MKIAVNTRLLLKNKLEGIGWFSYEVLKRITQNHPEHEFFFIFDRPFDEEFIFSPNVKPIVIYPPARHPFLWYAWFEYSIPYVLKKYKADLFFSPDGYLSLRTKIPSIPVIHDINFVHYAHYLPKLTANYYNRFFPQFARKARKIITVSEFSKQEIIDNYGISADKISVVYNGYADAYKYKEEVYTLVLENITHRKDYFLFVGALSPRKNIERLLAAFELFKERTKSDFKLVIVGEKMHLTEKMEAIYQSMHYRREVLFLGRLNLKQLVEVYSAAFALVFVPIYEGFGIPLLEAMATQTPIIASEISSLPEVAGNAAYYVNPFDVPEIAEAMMRLSADENLIKVLKEMGNIRKEDFSWDKTAQGVWKVLEQV